MIQPLLYDIPETIETERLWLKVPSAGWGERIHEAIVDGYEDYVRWLNWNPTPPIPEETEIECRTHHAKFILREDMRYLIIEKSPISLWAAVVSQRHKPYGPFLNLEFLISFVKTNVVRVMQQKLHTLSPCWPLQS